MSRILVLLFMTLPMIAGCVEDDKQSRLWQQQQIEHMQQQAKDNTAAARALVEADASARQQLIALERDVQRERAELGRQRDQIELERKALASERQRAPLIAATLHGVGMLLLATLPLILCWLLLCGAHVTSDPDELESFLILSLAGDESGLSASHQLPCPQEHTHTSALLS